MSVELLKQYQLYAKDGFSVPKANLKNYIEGNFVKKIYIAYGVEKGIDIFDTRYQQYVEANYKKAYKTAKALKIDELWNIGLNGGCTLTASNFQSAMQMLSIIKAASNKIIRDKGLIGGTGFQNGYAYGYFNIIMGDKKYDKKSFCIALICDQVTQNVILQISD